jgi:hypothetical protein
MNTDNTAIALKEYLSQDAFLKYTGATAGLEINYLFDHDYNAIYVEALAPFSSGKLLRWITELLYRASPCHIQIR